VSYLAAERTEQIETGVVVRRDGVDFGVVDQTRLAERVQTWQSLGFVVRKLTDLAHQQLRAQPRRVALRHRY